MSDNPTGSNIVIFSPLKKQSPTQVCLLRIFLALDNGQRLEKISRQLGVNGIEGDVIRIAMRVYDALTSCQQEGVTLTSSCTNPRLSHLVQLNPMARGNNVADFRSKRETRQLRRQRGYIQMTLTLSQHALDKIKQIGQLLGLSKEKVVISAIDILEQLLAHYPEGCYIHKPNGDKEKLEMTLSASVQTP